MNPAIVVLGYNRPSSLARLLASIGRADVADGVSLVISIDGGGEHYTAVCQVASQFEWSRGEKRVICHLENLGLIGNVFFGGDLALDYGRIILLEDDLVVSRAFYRYATSALDFFEADERVSGISLNSLWFNGFTHWPFIPIHDGSDGFFMQVGWFQGQAYSSAMWAHFKTWLEQANFRVSAKDPLHETFAHFPETDWFPTMTKYLVESGRYYLFPRESLTTNFGELGTHFDRPTRFFQVPLQHNRAQWGWLAMDDADSLYDSYQELESGRLVRLCPWLAGFSFDIDLNGTKSLAKLKSDYVLTTKSVRTPLRSFGMVLRPLAANVIENIPGSGISFCRRESILKGRWARLAADKRLADYYGRGPRISWKRRLAYWILSHTSGFKPG